MHEDLLRRYLPGAMLTHYSFNTIVDLTQPIAEVVTAGFQRPAVDKTHPCAGDVDNAVTGNA